MKKIFVLIAILLAAACDDFFEKDISGDSVEVVSPVDGVTAPEGAVRFLWRSTEGASSYRVTVVSPSFATASMVIADTLLRNDSIAEKLSLRLVLAAGSYQWSIRAQNSAYATADQIYTLFIAPPAEPEP